MGPVDMLCIIVVSTENHRTRREDIPRQEDNHDINTRPNPNQSQIQIQNQETLTSHTCLKAYTQNQI